LSPPHLHLEDSVLAALAGCDPPSVVLVVVVNRILFSFFFPFIPLRLSTRLNLARSMSLHSSGAPNGLPWLADDNVVEWQAQVMAYLRRKQLAQYVLGWSRHLAPTAPATLSASDALIPHMVADYNTAFARWEADYDGWLLKDSMAMGVIEGTLRGQYLTYVSQCATSKDMWDAIMGRLRTQNLGLAAHNTKQQMYNHPYVGGPVEDYLKHFVVVNEQLARIGKALPDSDVAHWMLENLPKDDVGWKSVISSFYTIHPDPDLVTSFQATVAIRNHYNQLTAPPTSSNSAYIAPTFESAYAARLGRASHGSTRPVCTGCKKVGHTVDACYDHILGEMRKMNERLPRSLRLTSPPRAGRANLASDEVPATRDELTTLSSAGAATRGSSLGIEIVDDRDDSDDGGDVALMAAAVNKGEVFVSAALNGRAKSAYREHVYVDSGASRSLSPIIHYFDPATLKQLKNPVVIRVGNNEVLLATAMGDLPFLFNVGDSVKRGAVKDVLYCADIATTLISASQLNARGNRVVLDGSASHIVDKSSGRTIARMHLTKSGLYRLDASPNPSKVFVSLAASLRSMNINDLHRRLGHLAFDDCKKLVYRGMIEGIDALRGQQDFCPGCVEGKIHRAPFPVSNSFTANKLHRVHSDLAGPFPRSLHGCTYFVIFFDEFSKKLWVYFMARKSETYAKFREWKAMAELQAERKLREFQSDNGGEYVDSDFGAYLKSEGIVHRTSTAYTPQQNGKAERSIRTILERAISMLRAANLSDGFWQDAVETAVHLINRSTRTGLKRVTPEEAWSGARPDAASLRVFGCPAYVLIPKELRVGKLAHKIRRCIFVGYSSTRKAWRFWNPVKRSFIESRDVIFDERVRCCDHPLPPVDLSSLELMDEPGLTVGATPADTSPVTDMDIQTRPVIDSVQTHLARPPLVPLPVAPPPVAAPVPPRARRRRMNEVERLLDFFEHHPLLDRDAHGGVVPARIEGELAGAELERTLQASLAMLTLELGPKDEAIEDVIVLAATASTSGDISIPPSNLHEALQRPDATQWIEAIRREMDSLTHTNTFIEVDQVPTPFTPIGSKFVFSHKKDVSGKIIRFKARLVAQGFSQQEGIDYTSTFAPVVRLTSIRIALAIATNLNLKMDHIDVETAFLNGKIDEEIYMRAPKGFEKLGLDTGNLWRLHGSLYGLKQASQIWNKLLDQVLKSFGWCRLSSDWCIYIWRDQKGHMMILAVHVDDMLLAGNSRELMEEAKAWLAKHFKIKDMGNPKLIVGLEIIRDEKEGTTAISQGHFIDELAVRYHQHAAPTAPTPLSSGFEFTNEDSPSTEADKQEMTHHPYRSLVGALMYIMIGTRPDISFAVGCLSRFLINPGKRHWEQALRVLNYLRGTRDLVISYSRNSKGGLTLQGFSDSDWAGEKDGSRSTSGYIWMLSGGPISWKSRLQPIVALSSTEAEYITITAAAQEGIWLRRVMAELGFEQVGATSLAVDNEGAIALSENPQAHPRTKHIRLRYHFIRQYVQEDIIKPHYVSTHDNVADIFTKNLPKDKFLGHRRAMGLTQRASGSVG